MTGLVLVAAGGLARETLAAARAGDHWNCFCLVDDDPDTWGTVVGGAPVAGAPEWLGAHPDHRVTVCAGAGGARRLLVRRLETIGITDERWATVRHPSVDVPRTVQVGAGSVLLAQVALTADIRVGRHVVVMPNATLTHDVVVEDFATLCAGVSLGGGVRVGSGAYVGMNATVHPGVTIGADAVVGMGAVVLHDVPPGQVWAGVPAVRIDEVRQAS